MLIHPKHQSQPRQVLLFSGHMIDAPMRPTSRFPAEKESIAALKMAEALDQPIAGAEDVGLTQGACGGEFVVHRSHSAARGSR